MEFPMGRVLTPAPSATATDVDPLWCQGAEPYHERELLVRSLKAALDDARAAKHAKAAFLASVSHELRTPLNAILGFAELIAKEQFGPHSSPKYSESARSIEEGARRLFAVLSDILDMAQLESGRMELHRGSVDPEELIGEVLAIVRERSDAGQAHVDVRIDPVLPNLWTDRTRLRQILVNLISNALAFTPAHGRVIVYGHFAPSGAIEIAVADTGSGMSPDEINRAVTRFGHATSESTRKHQGIGLGLPLAKSLTELLGGRLRVESAKGNGTVVTLNFALEVVSQPSAPTDGRLSARLRKVLGA
jgi:signal transduction histidine kinase